VALLDLHAPLLLMAVNAFPQFLTQTDQYLYGLVTSILRIKIKLKGNYWAVASLFHWENFGNSQLMVHEN